MGKNSYERSVYESVDDKSLSWDISILYSTKKRIHAKRANFWWKFVPKNDANVLGSYWDHIDSIQIYKNMY